MLLTVILLLGAAVLSRQVWDGLMEVLRVRAWQRYVLSQIALAVCVITGCMNSPHFDVGDNEYVCGPHL